MNTRRLKIILVVLQGVPLVAVLVLAAATSAGRTGAPAGDGVVAAALAIVYIPYLASVALTGLLASRMKRSVLGWVFAALFLPIVGPLILVSRRSPDRPSPAAAPTDHSHVVPASAADPAHNSGGFCTRCLSETTVETPGNMTTFNGIGTALMGTRWRTRGLQECAACGSVVQTKWFTFGFGVKPLGTYRVIYTKRGQTTSRLFARRLRDDPVGR
jgi:hypothetical protein